MRKHTQFSERKRHRRKIVTAIAILIAIALVMYIALWIVDRFFDGKQGNTDFPIAQKVDNKVVFDGNEFVKKNDMETLLVMGLDKFQGEFSEESYNNDRQADFLMLFVFDHSDSSYSALHINRDTMAQMDIIGVGNQKVGTVTQQLALAHTYGDGKDDSCENTVDAVSRVLNNTEIEHYLSVTMDAVPKINDRVGGVEVTVLDDFTGIDNTLLKGEIITLQGDQALTYVRTRYGMDDSTNNTRMVRQRQYLENLFDTAKKVADEDENFVVDTTLQMADYFVSDYTINEMQDLLNCISDYEFDSIYSIDGEFKMGQKNIEFYPDENSVEKALISLLYTQVK